MTSHTEHPGNSTKTLCQEFMNKHNEEHCHPTALYGCASHATALRPHCQTHHHSTYTCQGIRMNGTPNNTRNRGRERPTHGHLPSLQHIEDNTHPWKVTQCSQIKTLTLLKCPHHRLRSTVSATSASTVPGPVPHSYSHPALRVTPQPTATATAHFSQPRAEHTARPDVTLHYIPMLLKVQRQWHETDKRHQWNTIQGVHTLPWRTWYITL